MPAPASLLRLSLLQHVARPYQLEGARFVYGVWSRSRDDKTGVKPHRAAMLADDPGLGKTLQTLILIAALNLKRVLVVGPAIARVAWAVEIAKHWPALEAHLRVPLFRERPGLWVETLDELVLVLSYDVFSQPGTLQAWAPALRARRWDLLVLDEAHYLKADSNRTRALYGGVSGETGLQAAADRVLLLSGTPCPNHAGELFPHYNAFWRDLLTHEGKPLGQTDFEERYTRYTDGPWGRAIHGSREQDRLRTALAPVILRRRREDVLPELPPLQLQDVPLTAGDPVIGTTSPAVREITEALRAIPVNALVARLGGAEGDEGLNTLRRLLGETKAGVAAEWVRERLGLGVDKILVFAWHTSVIAKLAELLVDFSPVTITGATTSSARSAAVHRFQNDPRVQVFIGQTRAAGSAITLTKATEVAIVEPSWVPGENDQAIARAWRLGQTQPVLVSFLYVPGSLDQRIMLAFRRKAQELMTLYVKNEPSKVITTGKHDHAAIIQRTAAVTEVDH